MSEIIHDHPTPPARKPAPNGAKPPQKPTRACVTVNASQLADLLATIRDYLPGESANVTLEIGTTGTPLIVSAESDNQKFRGVLMPAN